MRDAKTKKTIHILLVRLVLLVLSPFAPFPTPAATKNLPSLPQALSSKQDLWGLAALRQPNGPSYEFFEKLLPPPRYVNAAFHYYPIVLSGPGAPAKARLISNGSGINLAGQARSWSDVGTPVTFHVGPDEFVFGSWRDRLSLPTLAEGWLPIVEIRYRHPTAAYTDGAIPLDHPIPRLVPEIYRLEAFASTQPALAGNGVVFVKFDLAQGTNGFLAIEIGSKSPLKFAQGKLVDEAGNLIAAFDSNWRWERQLAVARIRPGGSATLAIPTKAAPDLKLDCATGAYDAQREACANTWRGLLARGMNLNCPEPIVNNAWRNFIVQNFELINGDRVHYSSGNQYDKLYEAEGTDAALGMLAWGYDADMRRWLVPLLDFTRKNLECHQAGFKLEDLCRYYWQTRDAGAVRELRPRWEKEAHLLADCRTNDVHLCPKGQYCGDIHSLVYSLTVNAKGWRALRDLSAVLDDIASNSRSSLEERRGVPSFTDFRAEARHYATNAAEFRKSVLTAIQSSIRRETMPPFVPVALYTNEPAHDPITDRRIGSYWNVVIDYVLASGIFPPGSPEESWISKYQEEHGGLCMGMLRAGGAENTFWTGDQQIWPLYTTRYAVDTLRRDDPERALVCLYGALAQGFTRNTFISGEGCGLTPLDDGGRLFYCPPNSAANSHFLSTLRYALVQDWDLDDDGRPDTLRLFFATPKRWLDDGKVIQLDRAPTAFGSISVRMESKLEQHEVTAQVDLPRRNQPKCVLLRARVPDGWRIVSARSGSMDLKVDKTGAADLSGLKGTATIRFMVAKK